MAWEGKSCFVTGGTSGIGRAIVEAFAAEKASVFTCAIHEADVDAALEEFRGKGYDVQGCACDLSKKENFKRLIEQVSSCFSGKLDVFVSNAGVSFPRTLLECTDEEYDLFMSTNLRPSFELSRLCYPLLKAGAPSSIIFIGSTVASRATVVGPVYSMTKASLRQLTMNLACEWAPDQIRVNCVAPGSIDTPINAALKTNEKLLGIILAETPMKRLGEATEIASVVVFLCGPGASFVTGQELRADGGMSIRGLGL